MCVYFTGHDKLKGKGYVSSYIQLVNAKTNDDRKLQITWKLKEIPQEKMAECEISLFAKNENKIIGHDKLWPTSESSKSSTVIVSIIIMDNNNNNNNNKKKTPKKRKKNIKMENYHHPKNIITTKVKEKIAIESNDDNKCNDNVKLNINTRKKLLTKLVTKSTKCDNNDDEFLDDDMVKLNANKKIITLKKECGKFPSIGLLKCRKKIFFLYNVMNKIIIYKWKLKILKYTSLHFVIGLSIINDDNDNNNNNIIDNNKFGYFYLPSSGYISYDLKKFDKRNESFNIKSGDIVVVLFDIYAQTLSIKYIDCRSLIRKEIKNIFQNIDIANVYQLALSLLNINDSIQLLEFSIIDKQK